MLIQYVLYSTYCISNFFWNILECSLLFVQFDLLSPSVLFSQLLTEFKNLAVVVVVAAAVAAAFQTEALIDSVPE